MKTFSLKPFAFLLGVVGVMAAMEQADAQQFPGRAGAQPVTTAATAPAATQWVDTTQSQILRVALNKAVSVRIAGPVKNVIVADPNIADIVLPEGGGNAYVYVVAKKIGSTSVIFEGTNGQILFEGDIQVDVDVAGIKAAIADMLPDEQIDVTSHRSGVFLKGYASSAGASAQATAIAQRFVANQVDVVNNLQLLGSQQVMIQVRVAEVNRTAIKQLGIDAGYAGNHGAVNIFTQGATSMATQDLAPFTSILAGTTPLSQILLGNATFGVHALEQQGVIKTLAEPTLTANSGENASFLAGGEFPFPIGLDQNGLPLIQFKEFGIRFNVTPTVIDEGTINLSLLTEVSQISNEVQVQLGTLLVNSISTRRAQTTVQLPSGGTLMIAGLLQNDEKNKIRGLPFLKDVPILGQLFASRDFQREESELVVMLTAYMAEPTSNSDRQALPTDGFAASDDIDMFVLGRLHKQYAKRDLPPYATPLAGTYGYIME